MPLFQKRRSLGTTLLAAWLIAHGAFAMLPMNTPLARPILGLMACVAGVLILLDR